MDVREATKWVGYRFKYRRDSPGLDTWHVMSGEVMWGDCDDFALTVMWRVCNNSWLQYLLWVVILHRYRFYHCITKTGEHHVVGCAGGLWFDNWTQAALPKEKFLEQTGHKIKWFYPGYFSVVYMFYHWIRS